MELPPDFPLAEFVQFYEAARRRLTQPSEPHREFNGACNLIGWRFRACAEYASEIVDSWRSVGVQAGFETQYARERALYGMFSCGVASLETISYSCHALLSVLTPPAFAFDEGNRRRSSLRWLRDQLMAELPNARLTDVIRARLDSGEWELWTDFRNTMTHRSDIPRIVYASAGVPLPPAQLLAFAERWSHNALAGDEAEFRALLTWLADAMRDMMVAATDLAVNSRDDG
ncbi:MAG: hypothetical protein IBJ03_11020 [Gemmatimonadaceae bacterium]|nr:hypothetical protein [Gemmatimonadaceae bacterium]